MTISELKPEHNYPNIKFCPQCGNRKDQAGIKMNGQNVFRCRACNLEFTYWVRYDPVSDHIFWCDKNGKIWVDGI